MSSEHLHAERDAAAGPQIVDFAGEFTLYPARSTGALRTRVLRHYPEHRRGVVSSDEPAVRFLKSRAAQSGMDHEENVSTEPTGAQAPPRIPRPHGHQERAQGARPPPGQGAQAPLGVTGQTPMIERLKKRREFLAAAKGHKTARRAFVLEALRARRFRPAALRLHRVEARRQEGGRAEPHPSPAQGSRAADRRRQCARRARLCAGRTEPSADRAVRRNQGGARRSLAAGRRLPQFRLGTRARRAGR